MIGGLEALAAWVLEGIRRMTPEQKAKIRRELVKNKKDATQNYAKVSMLGDIVWIPLQRLEVFMADNQSAELGDILPADLVKEKFDVLTGDDLELLADAGATWTVWMRDCPWSADYLRYWGAVILVPKEEDGSEIIRESLPKP